MALPPNPLDANVNLDTRVGVLERKIYGSTAVVPLPGSQLALASRKWHKSTTVDIPASVWTSIGNFVEDTADSSDLNNAITIVSTSTYLEITTNYDGIYTFLLELQNFSPYAFVGHKLGRFLRMTDGIIMVDNGQTAATAPPANPRILVVGTWWCKAGQKFRPQLYMSSATTIAASSPVSYPFYVIVSFHGSKEPKGDQGPPGPSIAIRDEGSIIENGVTSINFTGPGITATSVSPGQVKVDVQATGSGGGGDGVDEVYISTDQPADPNTFDLWYDPDAGSSVEPPPSTDLGFVFNQATASADWDIIHTLSFYPNVTVMDSAGDQIEGDVHHAAPGEVTIHFSAPFAGVAYLS